MSLINKRVVIIGGSTGIGLATAMAVVANGGQVVIAGRSREKLESARARIGPQAQALPLDMSDEAAVKTFFLEVGAFDHLVTPGGAMSIAPFHKMPSAEARACFDSKFWGQYHAARHGAPNIRPGGSLVLFSGVYAHRPPPTAWIVAAVNSAVEGLARGLAVELSPIRVNCISPGLVDTPVWTALPDDQRNAMFAKVAAALPAKRIGKPEDIAQTALYLMSNGFTTGAIIAADGGHLLQ